MSLLAHPKAGSPPGVAQTGALRDPANLHRSARRPRLAAAPSPPPRRRTERSGQARPSGPASATPAPLGEEWDQKRTKAPGRTPEPERLTQARLLELDLGTSLLELRLDLLAFFLGYAFLDRLRRGLDEVLGFLQAEAGHGADFLDHLDLLVADGGENDGELGLLLRDRGGCATASTRRSGHRPGRGGRNAPLFLEQP